MATILEVLDSALKLLQAGELAEAERLYREVLKVDERNVEAHFSLGNALKERGELVEAAECFRQALRYQPDLAEAHFKLGLVLQKQGRLTEAADCYRQAIRVKPDYHAAYNNLGVLYHAQLRLAEAVECFHRALELYPDFPDAHYNHGVTLLLTGKLTEGWQEYEWRWTARELRRVLPGPLWTGAPLANRTILLHSEQGFGDTLQFVRYAELVKQRGGRVIVECRRPLASLLACCAGVDQILIREDPLPRYDVLLPLLSLPRVFGTSLQNIPAKVPYLAPDEASVQRWQQKLGHEKRFKIGIAWQGNPDFIADQFRSIPLEHFSGIVHTPGVRVYSLQMGFGCQQLAAAAGRWPIEDLSDRPGDFQETAAIMRNLDLVITSDSAVAHLAGAIGVPVWVALPFAPDWRWLLEREDSPWYPTLRLFRQKELGNWQEVFQRIQQALGQMLASESRQQHLRGAACLGRGDLAQAADYLRRALELQPLSAEAYSDLAVVFKQQDKLDEAADCCRRAIALKPDFAQAHYNLAIVSVAQNQPDQAIAGFRRALELKPDFAEAYNNLALLLQDQNQLDQAVVALERAIGLQGDFANAHFNRGVALLLMGRLVEAWPEFEWRWKREGKEEPAFARPRWTGSPPAGRTILLRHEQGMGDTLQFVRYADLLRQRGARVIVRCPQPLASLVATAPGVDGVSVEGSPLPEFDAHIPLLSLPGIFRTSLESVPAKVPYLFPTEALVEQWKSELAPQPALKIGIAWQGSATYSADRVRSIPLVQFAGIARMAGIRLFSLQFGAGRDQLAEFVDHWPITDLGDRVGDFDNTAAIMRNLDLVITCDSAPAHLAGALGLPVWVALTFAPHWPWMLEREDSPWYPSMRLFRQARRGDWEPVFQKIEEALAQIVTGTARAQRR